MAIVDVRDFSVVEADGSFRDMNFTFFLEEVATAPVEIKYYTQDGSASEGRGDYSDRSGTATIQAGQSSVTTRILVRPDSAIEGDETFQLIAYAGQNAELADGAAALVATGTIIDNDDAVPDGPAGEGALAERIYGPEALAGIFPTIDVRDVAVIEGNSGFVSTRFLITLDRPATAQVTGQYFLQSGTATASKSDYSDRTGSFTIDAGAQTTWVSVNTRGDTLDEGDESFQLILVNPTNAVLSDNAAALAATATIRDDDDATVDYGDGGLSGFSTPIDGPYPEPVDVPTLRISDTQVVEGDSSFYAARFLVTLDRPAPANVTFVYATNSSDASDALGDYNAEARTVTIDAGEQSAWIAISVSGDNIIEDDETFSVVLTNIENAVFEDGAIALEAVATILDDDGGPINGDAGMGDPADPIKGPATGSTIKLQAVNTSIIEGNSGSETAYVYLLLSEPVVGTVSFDYTTISQSATVNTDYNGTARSVTLQEGFQSGFISISVRGDNLIEGDESFALRFSNPQGLEFDRGGNTMDATILIRDNDIGEIANANQTGPEFEYLEFTPGATQGNDTIIGDETGNQLAARAGDDVVRGGDSGDLIDGGDGQDSLYGDNGNDWITPGDGGGLVDGGDGRDMVSFATLSETPGRLNTQYRLILDLEAGTATTTGTDTYQLTNLERVTGTIYADFIRGDEGDNELRGLGDFDWFVVTGGNDVYDGGTGKDMVSFLEWTNDSVSVAGVFDTGAPLTGANVSGVVVDLANSANNTNLAAGHTFNNIERITGSGREDVFYGDSGENDFRGLGGYDWFVSSTGGRERYFGGDGIDTVTYFNATSGVEASLSNGTRIRGEETGTGTKGDAARDLYFEIEALVGSNFNDVLRGSSDQDFLSGLNGDDFLYGFGGADHLKGGGGNDRLIGGGGTDTAYFDGNFADFTFNRINADTITVVGEGIDRLIDMELMQFADQEVSVLSIL